MNTDTFWSTVQSIRSRFAEAGIMNTDYVLSVSLAGFLNHGSPFITLTRTRHSTSPTISSFAQGESTTTPVKDIWNNGPRSNDGTWI